jgi:hypothetical protein
MSDLSKKVIAVVVFATAMSVLEAAVVVYLRALYYPDGFTVALKITDPMILKIELAREIATIVMLVSIGYLAGKTLRERFAFFLLSFAVWDVGYYFFLKCFINWPASLFDWDILFLLPIVWVAPVIAPVLLSVAMIMLAAVLLRNPVTMLSVIYSWSLLLVGCVLVLFSFMSDYGRLLLTNDRWRRYFSLLDDDQFMAAASHFQPAVFNWNLFLIGGFFLLAGIVCISGIRINFRIHR